MRTIHIVTIGERYSADPEIRYYEDKNDAIRYINAVCDTYRDNWTKDGVRLIYEPDRDMWERSFYCPGYYSEVQFDDRKPLSLRLRKATLH